MNIKYFFISAVALFAQSAYAQAVFGNEAADTIKINNLLTECIASDITSSGDATVFFANKFLGVPYEANTLEGEPEALRVSLDGMDCTTFVESMMALAMTVDENRASWRDFTYNLQRLRYRNGEINGYPSRLHYIADWAVDNMHHGILSDVTANFPGCSYAVKSIDFMTANADKYPALADSAAMAQMKKVEVGYRRHRYPFIKSSSLDDKAVKSEFRNGDVVALTSSLKNLDVAHMGIVVLVDGEPYLIHASSSAGKVVISEAPFARYMKKNRQFTGARVFRLKRQ